MRRCPHWRDKGQRLRSDTDATRVADCFILDFPCLCGASGQPMMLLGARRRLRETSIGTPLGAPVNLCTRCVCYLRELQSPKAESLGDVACVGIKPARSVPTAGAEIPAIVGSWHLTATARCLMFSLGREIPACESVKGTTLASRLWVSAPCRSCRTLRASLARQTESAGDHCPGEPSPNRDPSDARLEIEPVQRCEAPQAP